MIKWILIFSTFYLNSGVWAQSDSMFFSMYMAKGNAIFEKLKKQDRTVNFDSAINAYNTAMLIFPELADSARSGISDVFKYIEEVNKEKIKQTDLARRNYEVAKRAREDAERLKGKADSARDKFNLFNLANAPYKYARLIRDGPKDAVEIRKMAFDSTLVGYCNHLDIIRDSLNTISEARLIEANIPDAKKDYADLREDLYFNNDLYERIYFCLDFHGVKQEVLRDFSLPDSNYFRVHQFQGAQETFSLSADSGAIVLKNPTGEITSMSLGGHKLTSITVADNLNRVICATDDHYIFILEPGTDGKLIAIDSIAMGTQVTAIDFVDSSKMIFFGTKGGDIGFIRYEGDIKKYQPVYSTENFFSGSTITAIDFFVNEGDHFMLTAGFDGKAVVYKVDSNFLVEGYKFSGNILPEPKNELGNILHASFDKKEKQVMMETTKNAQYYLWDPFTKSALEKYQKYLDFQGNELENILLQTKFY